MANDCNYDIRVYGLPTNIRTFFKYLQAEYCYSEFIDGEYKVLDKPYAYIVNPTTQEKEILPYHIGFRVFEAEANFDYEEEPADEYEKITESGYGYVAWSVASTLLRGGSSYFSDSPSEIALDLCDAAKKLDLNIEIFSSEPGMVFSEHYLIDSEGRMLEENCVSYCEVYIDEAESYEDLVKEYKEQGWEIPKELTEEKFNEAKKKFESYIPFSENLDEDYEWKWSNIEEL